ncbi:MAG TPA: hypothetical protein ENN05_13215 [Deltaproteobacteria bacterium]|nr:hypothetical protein [Deltaproteobacteria bacterium]
MTSTYDLISSIPSYMVEIISSHILGNPLDIQGFAEGLSDDRRLGEIFEGLDEKQVSLLMDMFELGSQVQWDTISSIYGDELDDVRDMLKTLGNKGVVFQGGLSGRDPIILLPSLIPLLEAERMKSFRSGDDLLWDPPGHLDIWGHIALINTVRSTRIRCKSGMEPFKRGWEFIEERLGSLLEWPRIYWELVELGCLQEIKGVVAVQHSACTDLAMEGDARYSIWRFLQSCKSYPGMEYRVFNLIGDKTLSKDFFCRCLILELISRNPDMPDVYEKVESLVNLWISFGVLQKETSGKWVRFADGVFTALQSGKVEVPLTGYSDEVIIQPNMEVLVPRDLDPIDLLNMGEIADVVRADVVSIYRLTKRSVFRALRQGWNADEIGNFFDRVSRHDVPDNILKTIKGWSASHAEAHIIKGTFLVFSNARHNVPQGLDEILPGIFRIPDKCDNDIAAFLDKRDVMVRGMEEESEPGSGISWGKLLPMKELSRYQCKALRKEGIYPFGMVTPLPYGTRGEVVFEEALHEGRTLIIFYPRHGYGEIQVKKISPIYMYRKGGVPFVEAFCEDTGEGEVFDISKVRGFFSTVDTS